MKPKIAICGSAVYPDPEIIPKLKELAYVLWERNVTVVTGAAPGIPFVVAKEAYRLGSEVIGYSPSYHLEGHLKYSPGHDMSIYNKIHYIPEDTPYVDSYGDMKIDREIIFDSNPGKLVDSVLKLLKTA